jgi:hypothetical protein
MFLPPSPLDRIIQPKVHVFQVTLYFRDVYLHMDRILQPSVASTPKWPPNHRECLLYQWLCRGSTNSSYNQSYR